jgi:hypothetical protein
MMQSGTGCHPLTDAKGIPSVGVRLQPQSERLSGKSPAQQRRVVTGRTV